MFGTVAKSFGRNFLIAQLAPTSLFIGANVVLIRANFLPRFANWSDLGISKALLILITTCLLAILLRQFTTPVIRFYEGYHRQTLLRLGLLLVTCGATFSYFRFIPELGFVAFFLGVTALIFFIGQSISNTYHKNNLKRIRKCIDNPNLPRSERLSHELNLVRYYPLQENELLPTRVGNIIRAFEFYPFSIYNIDPILIWPRFLAILPQAYREQIEEAESNFQFLLNLSLFLIIMGVECLTASLYAAHLQKFIFDMQKFDMENMGVALSCFFFSYLFYIASCTRALEWGENVRSVFDLYRLDLLEKFGIFLPPYAMDLKQERGIWTQLQRVTQYARRVDSLSFRPKFWTPEQILERSEDIYLLIKRAAENLHMSEREMVQKILKEPLTQRLHVIKEEIKEGLGKTGTNSLENLKALIKEAPIEKRWILESELQKVEELKSNAGKIMQLLEEINIPQLPAEPKDLTDHEFC